MLRHLFSPDGTNFIVWLTADGQHKVKNSTVFISQPLPVSMSKKAFLNNLSAWPWNTLCIVHSIGFGSVLTLWTVTVSAIYWIWLSGNNKSKTTLFYYICTKTTNIIKHIVTLKWMTRISLVKISLQRSRVVLIISNLNDCNPSNFHHISGGQHELCLKELSLGEASFLHVFFFFCLSEHKLVRHFQHHRKSMTPSGKFSTQVITFVSCPYTLLCVHVNISPYAWYANKEKGCEGVLYSLTRHQ